jgi:ADP-ribosylglycohydrolase
MAKNLIDGAQGVLLGTFTGDALGMPLEGLSREQIVSKYGFVRGFLEGRLPAGSYTDDTEMALGLAESLVDRGGFDPADVATKFAQNFTLWRGYGSRTCGVISKIKAGNNWSTVGTDSWGNGGAMRIAPLGLFYCGSPLLKDAAEKSCRISHHHPNAIAGAAVMAFAVAEAVRCGLLFIDIDIRSFQEMLIPVASEYGEAMVRPLERLSDLRLDGDSESKAAVLSAAYPCDVSAVGSVPAALAAFLSAESFEDAVVTAVNAGGDADTLGAMAGALAGGYYGAAGIPEALLSGLDEGERGLSYVKELGAQLGEVAREGTAGGFELGEDEYDEDDDDL